MRLKILKKLRTASLNSEFTEILAIFSYCFQYAKVTISERDEGNMPPII